MSKIQYSFEDFNQYNVLKVPRFVGIIALYLMKHFLLAFIPVLALLPKMRMQDMSSMITEFAHSVTTTELLLSCIPAMMVFAAMTRRLPSTPENHYFRKIWRHGRSLLLLSLGFEILVFALYLVTGVKEVNLFILFILYVDAMMAIYLLRSQRAKDAFAEFPAYDEIAAKALKKK